MNGTRTIVVLLLLLGIWFAWDQFNPSPLPPGPTPPDFQPPRPFEPDQVTLETDPETSDFRLAVAPLKFVDPRGQTWIAPIGTKTDGASIPQVFLSLAGDRFEREYLKAAIVHDAYCDRRNVGQISYRSRPWQDVHRMFYEACVAGGAAATRAKLMYAAIWLGGPRWDAVTGIPLEPPSAETLAASFESYLAWYDDQRVRTPSEPIGSGSPVGGSGPPTFAPHAPEAASPPEPSLEQIDAWMERQDPWKQR